MGEPGLEKAEAKQGCGKLATGPATVSLGQGLMDPGQ